MKRPRIGGLYQHYRTKGIYRVIGVGTDEATKEEKVAYVDEEGNLWFRLTSLWFTWIDEEDFQGTRFTEVGGSSGVTNSVHRSASDSPIFKRRRL